MRPHNPFKPHRLSEIPSEPPSYEDSEVGSSATSSHQLISGSPRPLTTSDSQTSFVLAQSHKQKNVPYRPLKEQQAHIDQLGGSSVNALTTFSTGTKTEYFDVLPSFQMFQSILKRNDFEFDEDSLGQPPQYGDTTTSSPTPPNGPILDTRTPEIEGVLHSASRQLEDLDIEETYEEENEGQYLFSDNDSEEGLQRSSRHHNRDSSTSSAVNSRSNSRQPGGAVTHESYGHSVLDNIDKLPHSRASPLAIEIFVTKDVPAPNTSSELETKLKEYSCGDVVNGFVIITNTLEHDVDFGLFTVSLECTIKAIYLQSQAHENNLHHRILLKKILKMYDLNASYNYGAIPSSAGITYGLHEKDSLDGLIMGLPNNRILKANLKYKKFITFKFPQMLLDNSCPHNVMRHTMPPPSFGIDNTAFFDRASTIAVNKALGYGFLPYRGSPVKVRDYAFDDISVSYSIEAKFIDKQHTKNQRTAIDANDINDPNNDSKYIISKSALYFLRFVPDIKTQVETYSRTYKNFGKETFDTIGIDGMLFGTFEKRSTWGFVKFMNATLEQEIRNALDKREYDGDQMKRKNLIRDLDEERSGSAFHKHVQSDSGIDLEKLSYKNRRMIGNCCPVDVFGKKKKRLLLSSVKIGWATLYAQVPDKLIPYGSPRLIQRYNDGGDVSDDLSPTSSNRDGFTSLHPAISNMGELYHRDSDSILKSVKIEVNFESLDEKCPPPSVSLIECNIVAWSYRTDYPIPVSFEHDFFYTKPSDDDLIIYEDDVENTKINLQVLKDQVNSYISFLRENKIYVSQNIYSYLKGLSKLGVKKDTIKGYFQTLTASVEPLFFENASWAAHQTSEGQTKWLLCLDVPLKLVNKNNITLPPSFQSCLVGRLYCLQIVLRLKGADEATNTLKIDVPILVG